jgi:hypothetical protein
VDSMSAINLGVLNLRVLNMDINGLHLYGELIHESSEKDAQVMNICLIDMNFTVFATASLAQSPRAS